MADKYSTEQMIKALTDGKGLISVAARQLGCSRNTVTSYIAKYATVAQAAADAKEGMKDFAEGKLYERISKGDMTAIIFYLKTQAKDRGYVERQEVSGKDGGGIKIIHEYPDGKTPVSIPPPTRNYREQGEV